MMGWWNNVIAMSRKRSRECEATTLLRSTCVHGTMFRGCWPGSCRPPCSMKSHKILRMKGQEIHKAIVAFAALPLIGIQVRGLIDVLRQHKNTDKFIFGGFGHRNGRFLKM